MWKVKLDIITADTIKVFIQQDNRILTYQQVIKLWKTNTSFIDFFITILKNIDFQAYFWETPVLTTKSQAFQCVFIESQALAQMSMDMVSFQQYFLLDKWVVSFENLRKDATLVTPCPYQKNNYTHLKLFSQFAPKIQQYILWQQIAILLENNITRPIWLNTSGLGVGWLHVRLDLKPKYYKFLEYRKKVIC